jgi:hypothetical protein
MSVSAKDKAAAEVSAKDKAAADAPPPLVTELIVQPKRSVYRVNYYLHGTPVTAFVCAFTDSEASAFVGVRDGSAQVSRVASPVEVVGLDPVHVAIAPMPVTTVPAPPHEQLTQEELARLRALLDKP